MTCPLAVLVCDRLHTWECRSRESVVAVPLTVLACVFAHVFVWQRSEEPALLEVLVCFLTVGARLEHVVMLLRDCDCTQICVEKAGIHGRGSSEVLVLWLHTRTADLCVVQNQRS